MPLGGSAFHADKSTGNCIDAVPSPVIDSEIFVELIGISNVEKINALNLSIWRSAGLKNAVALMQGASRLIIIDPEWVKTISAESYLVFGHEAGHHFCGHTIGSVQRSPREAELEADRFSGASIKRFEAYHRRPFIDDALKAAARLYSASGSRSHPPRAARLEAIMLGYSSGSPCGSLSPGIHGYSPNPR